MSRQSTKKQTADTHLFAACQNATGLLHLLLFKFFFINLLYDVNFW